MIDPRFANAGAVPLVPGYGAQQIPAQYHHHHRHHRHHKHKVRNDASPVSLDESIHKVDHSQPQYFQQNDGAAQGGGYGVPYGAGGYETGAPYGAATAFYPQQQYGGANFAYANQYQAASYGQGPFVAGPAGPIAKHHRRHHRHHRHHTAEAVNTGADQAQAVPEQLIGQRSSSVLDNEQQQQQQQQQGSSSAQGEGSGEQTTQHKHHRRHHHHRHHQSGENAGFEQAQQAQQSQSTHHHTTVGANGYGHINDELIFIERGDHSPHRQEPPPGYEYKGKIEVQNIDRERTTQIHGQSTGNVNIPPPIGPAIPNNICPPPGACPPGWHQAVLTPAHGIPCPPGNFPYIGEIGAAVGQVGIGGFGSGLAQIGISGFGLGGSLPPNCHVVGDYNFGSSSGGVISTGGSTSGGQFQQVETNVTSRATVIEVWQKQSKSETRERSRSKSRQHTRTPTTEGPSFDFERFRNEILAAVERAVARGGPSTGTQTQIHTERGPYIDNEKRTEISSGEVRVIVQPIQPVFYMPRQTGGTTTTTVPQIGPAPVGPQPAPSGAPHIVYVPRNVYVPVIKPVFVPRERIIVRPQVIHVARPVLVDRPVPVTQRPIIIDRERPIPVPVRSGGQAAQAGGSKVVREEYVYRDNLPVAYGGRCAEFAGGVNYGYMPSQQEHQYANSSTHETASIYQNQGQAVNINVPSQFQQSTSSSHVEVQQGGGGSYHGSYSNLAEVGNAAAVNVGQLNQAVLQQTFEQSAQIAGGQSGGPTQVEVLDTAVNPFWQKTDQSSLVRRYGRPAVQIVNQSQEVEQQMYNEIRQRTSSGGVVRSSSTASFGSSSGIGVVGCEGGYAQY